MNKTNINIISDYQNPISESMFNRFMLNKFEVCIDTLLITKDNISNFEKGLLNKYPGYSKKELAFQKYQTLFILENEDDWLISYFISKDLKEINVSIYAKNYSICEKLLQIFKEHQIHSEEFEIRLTNLFLDNGRIKESYKILTSKEFEDVEECYYPYIKTDSLFDQFTKSKENILLITGAPGIGKTKLINLYMKYMIDNNTSFFKKDFDDFNSDLSLKYSGEALPILYIKSEELLSRDNFWNYLMDDSYALVILDDFDNFLSPRTDVIQTNNDELKNKFISSFLSYTDGTVSNKTKFIITTNRNIDKIDPALLRRGRTFDILNLRTLKNIEAKNIWIDNGLEESVFEEKFNSSESITQAELGSEIFITKEFIKSNLDIDSYLLEDNISVLNKLRTASTKKTKISFK